MNVNDIKNILKFMNEGNFDSIYENYGNVPYAIFTPLNEKEIDIDILLEDKEYRKLYEKYGPNIFDEYMERKQSDSILKKLRVSRKSLDILSIERNLRRTFHKTCLVAFSLGRGLAAAYISFAILMLYVGVVDLVQTNVNAKTYEKEIEEYNLEIEEYADYMNSLGLTDLEIIEKYIYDMHTNIEYRESEANDCIGYERLTLYRNEYGVCHNMADDFAARMNAINPDYEVFNMHVYMGKDINFIEYLFRKDAQYNINYFLESSVDYFIMRYSGNHMISCVRLEDGSVLIVDVTNSLLGTLEDGKIKIFNEYFEQNEYEMDMLFLGNIQRLGTFDNYIRVIFDSYIFGVDSKLLEEQYGEASQEVALDFIKENYDTEHYGTQKVKRYE